MITIVLQVLVFIVKVPIARSVVMIIVLLWAMAAADHELVSIAELQIVCTIIVIVIVIAVVEQESMALLIIIDCFEMPPILICIIIAKCYVITRDPKTNI